MAAVKKVYDVNIGGLPHSMRLSDADAERLGLVKESKRSDAPAKDAGAKEAGAPANKSRAASNKDRG